MENHISPQLEQTLSSMQAEITQMNAKLDHIVLQLADDYYRQFHRLYGPDLEG